MGLRGSNLLTDADIDSWAERIIRESAHATQWFQTTTTVSSVLGTADYDLPSGCIALKAVYYSNLPLPEIAFHDLVERDPHWRLRASGTPLWWYRRGMAGYTLHPTPASAVTNGIRLYYSATPALPSGDSDTFDFPTANEGLLISFCAYRACLKMTPGEGEKKVEIYQREYMAELERFKQAYADLGEAETFVVGIDSDRPSWRNSFSHLVVPDPY